MFSKKQIVTRLLMTSDENDSQSYKPFDILTKRKD